MSINTAAAKTVYELTIDNFTKTLAHGVVIRTVDNMSGSETLAWASNSNISGAFFRRQDNWSLRKDGFYETADAILMLKIGVSVAKDDKITYDSQQYLINTVITRYIDGTAIYQAVELFQYEATV